MISKIIHQIWFRPEGEEDKPLPENFSRWSCSWKLHHPEWEYILWDRSLCDLFVAEHWPQCLRLYSEYPKNIYRIDFVRYLILHTLGGLYVDMDFECLRPFDDLMESELEFFVGTHLPSPCKTMSNALIASKSKHGVLEDLIQFLLSQGVVDKSTPLTVTGPSVLSKQVKLHVQDSGVKVFDFRYFYPFSWKEKEQAETKIYPETYARHYWASLWRKKSSV